MVTESSAENRKVDKKTALALWETTVPPPVLRKKRTEENDEDGEGGFLVPLQIVWVKLGALNLVGRILQNTTSHKSRTKSNSKKT